MNDPARSPEASEDDLIRRAAHGDRTAFSRLTLLHQGALRGFCARFAPDLDAADDAAQEAFLRAFKSIHRFEVGSDFGKWLRGIARHLLQDALRRLAREARVRGAEIRARAAERLAQRLLPAEAGEDSGRQLAALSKCLEALGDGPRELVRAHYQDNLSAAEIARRLEKGLSSVRMQLLRVRRILRRCMQTRLVETGP